MTYIGKAPNTAIVNQTTSQSFNGTGSATAFTLNRSVNVSEDLEVFVNNVQQEPGSGKAYTASGTTLTFSAAPASGTGNIYVIYRGEATINPRLEHDANAALAATTGTFSGAVSGTTGTFTGAFTSPGIDDNADATAITIDSSERVGFGTTSPNTKIEIDNASNPALSGVTNRNTLLQLTNSDTGYVAGNATAIDFGGKLADGNCSIIGKNLQSGAGYGGELIFATATTSNALTERVRILSTGGITFNGDTAAANALDDYEEGTWTGTLKGSSSDPSTAVTATGYYTKVGRLVNILIDFNNVNTTGASGTVSITGMPFTSGTNADTPANGNAATYNFNIHSCNNMSVQVASSGIFIYCSRDQNSWVNATHLAGTGRYLGITATYFVN